MSPRPPLPTLFPYTTLFRSAGRTRRRGDAGESGKGVAVRHGDAPAVRVGHDDVDRAHRVGRRHDPKSRPDRVEDRSEEHTSELQSRLHLVCRLLLEKKKAME